MKKNTYFLMRHGPTAYQEEKQGWAYPQHGKTPLSSRGREAVRCSAEALREPLDVIYASDFKRTLETAKIVSARKKAPIYKDKRLRDTNLGIYHGKKKEIFYRDFPVAEKMLFSAPPKGESWNNVLQRVWEVLEEIENKFREKNVLLVSHGDPLWLLEGKWQGLSEREILACRQEKMLKPAEIRKLELR